MRASSPRNAAVEMLGLPALSSRRSWRSVDSPTPALDPRDCLTGARDVATGPGDLLLQLVEPEDRLRAGEVDRAAGAEVGRKAQHLVHVPLGVVVGEDGAGDVVVRPGSREIAGRGEDGVVRVPRVGEAVAVRVHPPAQPGVGHELHPAHRAGRARAHVAPEVRLDLVDRAEHLPRHAVRVPGAVPEDEELLVGANGRLLRRHRERERDVDGARAVRRLRARERRGPGGHDREAPRRGPAREGEHDQERRCRNRLSHFSVEATRRPAPFPLEAGSVSSGWVSSASALGLGGGLLVGAPALERLLHRDLEVVAVARGVGGDLLLDEILRGRAGRGAARSSASCGTRRPRSPR